MFVSSKQLNGQWTKQLINGRLENNKIIFRELVQISRQAL